MPDLFRDEEAPPGAGAANITEQARTEGLEAFAGGPLQDSYWAGLMTGQGGQLWADPGVIQAGGLFAPMWEYGDVATGALLSDAEAYARAAAARQTHAQAQLRAGTTAAQRDLLGAAQVRGYSPAAMRGAAQAGAGLGARAAGQAARIRAEEMRQAEQMRQQAMAAAQQQAMGRGGQLAQRYGIEQGAVGTLAGLASQQNIARMQQSQALEGALLSGGGALLGELAGEIPKGYDPAAGEFTEEKWGD